VRLLALDPRLLLQMFDEPDGDCARLFLVMAYGRASYLSSLAGVDEATLSAAAFWPSRGPAADYSGALKALTLKALIPEALRVKRVLENHLPPHPPNEWGLAMTDHIYARFEETMEIARSVGAVYLDIKASRLTVDLHVGDYFPCPAPSPLSFTFTLPLAPALDELLKHGMLLGCEYLVTNDPHLTGTRGRRVFTSPRGVEIVATTLDRFTDTELNRPDFSLYDIENPGDLVIKILPEFPSPSAARP
jgi:hypothetical protein